MNKNKKIYKVKHNITGLFWDGYGDSFSAKGNKWNSVDAASYDIRKQIRYRATSVNTWINQATVLEYKVFVEETDQVNLKEVLLRDNFHNKLSDAYGSSFIRAYHKIIKCDADRLTFKYAIQIPHAKYAEFREDLKGLGFSSRHYRKVDTWLWISSDDVMLRVKLLDYCSDVVELGKEEQALRQVINQGCDIELR